MRDKDRQHAMQRAAYQRRKTDYMARTRKRRKAVRDHLSSKKQSGGCSSCGESDPATLDFYHRGLVSAVLRESPMVNACWSLERVDAALAGCDLFCSNCARKRGIAQQ
jgi:hypothetical protein